MCNNKLRFGSRPSPHYHCDKAIDRGLPVLGPPSRYQSHLDFKSHSCQWWGYSECTWDISLELQRLPARCQNISMGTRFRLKLRLQFRSRSPISSGFHFYGQGSTRCAVFWWDLNMTAVQGDCLGLLDKLNLLFSVFNINTQRPRAEPDGIGIGLWSLPTSK